MPQSTHTTRWTKQWRWTDAWADHRLVKTPPSFVECTMKLCSDLKCGIPFLFPISLGFLSAASPLLLKDLCVRDEKQTRFQVTSRQIVTLTWMSLSSSTLFHPPGRRWVQVRMNYLLADCTLRKGQHQKDCGNTEAFTQEVMNSSRHLLFIFVCVCVFSNFSSLSDGGLLIGNE